MIGGIAILGIPPFGVFASEFTSHHGHARPSVGRAHSAARPGRGVRLIFTRLQAMVFGDTTAAPAASARAAAVFVHLPLVLVLGLYIPPYLVAWYRQAAAMIG